jgi:hypothetical protein
MDYAIALCARQAYWMYQRQLWDNVCHLPTTRLGASGSGVEEHKGEELEVEDLRGAPAGLVNPDVQSEFFFKLMPGGLVALMFVDVRGSRSFHYTRSRPFFGEQQWQLMKEVRRAGSHLQHFVASLLHHFHLWPRPHNACCTSSHSASPMTVDFERW